MFGRRSKKETSPEYLCPHCFGRFRMSEAHSICSRTYCMNEYVNSKDYTDSKKYLSLNGDYEIDYEYTKFRGLDPHSKDAIPAKHHIVRNGSMKCDMCGRPTYIRLCPFCHNEIPPGAEEGGNSIFVVLGPKGVGKSHYIAVLVDQLSNHVAGEFKAVFNPAGDSTMVHYNDMYRDPLFKEKRKLDSTKPYNMGDGGREPLVYYMNVNRNGVSKVFTFAFIDTAGEDTISTDSIQDSNLDTLIAGAAGIVFFVDPLQIKYIRDRIHIDNLPPVTNNATETLNIISNVIRRKQDLGSRGRIGIPLAVSLTKCDVLLKAPEDEEEDKILFSPGSAVRIPRESGRYDAENFEQIDVEIEEYLRRTAGEDFIQTVNGFEDHCYFAVSALGNNPEGKELQRGVMPMRVEDPFIWLLNRKGME